MPDDRYTEARDVLIHKADQPREETICWAREEVDPHCCVPQWFVQKFRRVMDDENEAAALLNMYMDQLLQKSEFEIIYETGRKLFLEENEGGQCAMAETMAIV